jgi:MFS family permease
VYLDFSVQSAALLMSLFFAFQFISRVIGIVVAALVQPGKMLIFNVSLTAVFFMILLAVVNVWPTIIWITIPLASFTTATTFAAGMLWISDRITITGRISSLILVGHSSGAIVSPIIVGQLFERSTPMWFVYVLTASSIIVVVLLFVLMFYDRRYGDRVTRYANPEIHSNDNEAPVASSKNSGYKSVHERDDNLELTSNMETNESAEGLPSLDRDAG